jgi:hypothetical protein
MEHPGYNDRAVGVEIREKLKPLLEILDRYSTDNWEDISFSMGIYRCILEKLAVEVSGLSGRASTRYVGSDEFGNKMRKMMYKQINSSEKALEKALDGFIFHYHL